MAVINLCSNSADLQAYRAADPTAHLANGIPVHSRSLGSPGRGHDMLWRTRGVCLDYASSGSQNATLGNIGDTILSIVS